MSNLLIILLAAAYLGLLLAVAWRGDRPSAQPLGRRSRAVVYALSLGIYCTSWTYFGAVGTASRSGWEYLPIYLGPALGLIFLFPAWRRILDAAKREKSGSVADFLAARYAKSRSLGALATVVLLFSALPYIALQLKSIATLLDRLSHGAWRSTDAPMVNLVAAALAAFAIVFGARRADLTEKNRGLVQVVAVESVVKLLGILAAAGLGLLLIARHGGGLDWRAALGPLAAPPRLDLRFVVLTVLSTAAIFCLPRQFHMAFVEVEDREDATAARRLFPAYLLAFSVAVPVIVAAGRVMLGAGGAPDFYVADLGLSFGADLVSALVVLGGFSAATAMVVVESVALSAMISNHLILPLLGRWLRRSSPDAAQLIVGLRRAAIVGVMALAVAYFMKAPRDSDLASIGLIAFAGAAQLAPALLGGVFWRRAHATGALMGMAAGFAIWAYVLFIPQVLGVFALDFGLAPVFPLQIGHADPLVIGAIASLVVNAALFVAGSFSARHSLLDRVQASSFTALRETDRLAQAGGRLGRTAGDLFTVVGRFLGEEGARRGFDAFETESGRRVRLSDPVDPGLARAAERMLTGALGASSARSVIAHTLSDDERDASQVVRLLDEAAQAVQFNRELLQATLDNLSQAVSVVDADLRLVAWNAAYLEMLGLEPEALYVGRPIADIIRINTARSGASVADQDEMVTRRLEHLRRGQRHVYERAWPDGRVMKSMGAPMPGGGYVTSYTDITDLRHAADALAEANEQLESRVDARTRELAEAKALAEAATESKTRFLAAASHDLLQPLHAARLFVGALSDDLKDAPDATKRLAVEADRSIASADRLLRALLNLSKLEAGGVKPTVRGVSVAALFDDLRREFAPLARERGLRLRFAPTSLHVATDRDLLRSILQNLITNALRYTRSGGVLVGARRSGPDVRLMVCDSGPGIPNEAHEQIFREFQRLDAGVGGDGGVGLGLAIVDRVARLLGHPVSLQSRLGHGSTFSVTCPRADSPEALAPERALLANSLSGMRVLCVDNEPAILTALASQLARWKVETTCAGGLSEALALSGRWDAALVDQHLGDGLGLDLLERLGVRAGRAALVTADAGGEVAEAARAREVTVIGKPVRPAVLKAFLASALT